MNGKKKLKIDLGVKTSKVNLSVNFGRTVVLKEYITTSLSQILSFLYVDTK